MYLGENALWHFRPVLRRRVRPVRKGRVLGIRLAAGRVFPVGDRRPYRYSVVEDRIIPQDPETLQFMTVPGSVLSSLRG